MTTPDQPGDQAPQRAPHIQALEAQLAALRPRADRLDRERLMFLAGQASVQAAVPRFAATRARWAWPASLGSLAGATGALLLVAALRLTLGPRQPVAAGNAPRAAMPPDAAADSTTKQQSFASSADDFDMTPTWRDVRRGAADFSRTRFAVWFDLDDPMMHSDERPMADAGPLPVEEPPLTSRSFNEAVEQLTRVNASS